MLRAGVASKTFHYGKLFHLDSFAFAVPSRGPGTACVRQRRPCSQHSGDAAHAVESTEQIVSYLGVALGANVASKTLRYVKP